MILDDWQALDACIAREVMGWHTEGTVWWYDVGRTVKDGGLSIDGKIIAHTKPMEPWPWPPSPLYQYKIWSPHKDVAQAMQAVDALVEKHPAIRYWLAYKPLGRPDPDYWFTVWQPYCELYGHSYDGSGSTRAHAICLGLEKWLDGQKEKHDDPG